MKQMELPFIKYALVETQADMARVLDDLINGVTKMLGKTGERGQSPEVLIRTMMSTVGNPNAFLLTAYDMEDVFAGFCYAVAIPAPKPWVDFMGVYTRPGLASRVKYEVFGFLRQWARSRGASRIYAGITRKPEIFFKFFHEPLGFKKIGIIVECDLREAPNATTEAN